MSHLTEYERKVLAAFAGNSVDALRQGAALNQAAEMLVSSGYMGEEGNLHDKGFTELGIKSPLRSPSDTNVASHGQQSNPVASQKSENMQDNDAVNTKGQADE